MKQRLGARIKVHKSKADGPITKAAVGKGKGRLFANSAPKAGKRTRKTYPLRGKGRLWANGKP